VEETSSTNCDVIALLYDVTNPRSFEFIANVYLVGYCVSKLERSWQYRLFRITCKHLVFLFWLLLVRQSTKIAFKTMPCNQRSSATSTAYLSPISLLVSTNCHVTFTLILPQWPCTRESFLPPPQSTNPLSPTWFVLSTFCGNQPSYDEGVLVRCRAGPPSELFQIVLMHQPPGIWLHQQLRCPSVQLLNGVQCCFTANPSRFGLLSCMGACHAKQAPRGAWELMVPFTLDKSCRPPSLL
jgi:hypothetical protein